MWAAISKKGRSGTYIIEGCMVAIVGIVETTLLPMIEKFYKFYLIGHRFIQDNDPKHTSTMASVIMESTGGIPHLSPRTVIQIENMWHELKEQLRQEVKP